MKPLVLQCDVMQQDMVGMLTEVLNLKNMGCRSMPLSEMNALFASIC